MLFTFCRSRLEEGVEQNMTGRQRGAAVLTSTTCREARLSALEAGVSVRHLVGGDLQQGGQVPHHHHLDGGQSSADGA